MITPPEKDRFQTADELFRALGDVTSADPSQPLVTRSITPPTFEAARTVRVVDEERDADTAPTLSGNVVPPGHPNNLPQQVTSFVGRERDLAEVRRLVSSGRLVTLTGPGGSGKTRLSRAAGN